MVKAIYPPQQGGQLVLTAVDDQGYPPQQGGQFVLMAVDDQGFPPQLLHGMYTNLILQQLHCHEPYKKRLVKL